MDGGRKLEMRASASLVPKKHFVKVHAFYIST